MRELIEALDELREDDVLDALRAEVSRTFRVSHVYCAALARRESSASLDAFLGGLEVHPWERVTRVVGALGPMTARASAHDLELFFKWSTLPPVSSTDAARPAGRRERSLLAQALAWCGALPRARALAQALEQEPVGRDPLDVAWRSVELAPVLVAIEPSDPRAAILLAEAQAAWDAAFDEDLDGYGVPLADAITESHHRLAHLRAQLALAPSERRFFPVRPKRYVSAFAYTIRGSGRAGPLRISNQAHDLMDAGDALAALSVAASPDQSEGQRAELLFELGELLPHGATPDQRDAAVEQFLRLAQTPPERARADWAKRCTPALCGVLARHGRLEEAFALAPNADGVSFISGHEARLACVDGMLGRRGTHPKAREAVQFVLQRLDPETFPDLFSTAELFLPLL